MKTNYFLSNKQVEWCVYWQAQMLKQEQEDLLKEQRKLEQAVSFSFLCVRMLEWKSVIVGC